MDASFQSRIEQLATEFASEATTIEDLNGLMMKSGLEPKQRFFPVGA